MDSVSFGKRVFNSVLIVALASLVTFFFPNWVFALLASALIGLGLSEFFGIVEKRGIAVYRYFGVIIGVLVPVIVYFQMGVEGYSTLEPFFIVIACLFLFVVQFTKRDPSQAVSSIAVTTFGLLYIAWFLSFAVKIKFLPQGALLVGFLVLVTKIGDVGAYLIGSAFGKHPLIPRISPKKTVEGTTGGLACSVVAALLSKSYLPEFPYGHLFTLGLLLGILGQVGDLAESLIKRDCEVKDAGSNFSGFGGVMDVIDSLLFTMPIFYFYLQVVMR